MHRRRLLALALAATALFSACRFTGSYEGPAGAIEVSGQIDPRSGSTADPGAKSLGRGTITLDNGTTYSGEFFDTDGNTQPDKFQPEAGQDHGVGQGSTNGSDWYELKPRS